MQDIVVCDIEFVAGDSKLCLAWIMTRSPFLIWGKAKEQRATGKETIDKAFCEKKLNILVPVTSNIAATLLELFIHLLNALTLCMKTLVFNSYTLPSWTGEMCIICWTSGSYLCWFLSILIPLCLLGIWKLKTFLFVARFNVWPMKMT